MHLKDVEIQLEIMAIFYTGLENRTPPLNSVVKGELRDKSRAIYLSSFYVDVFLWFLDCRLLPEMTSSSLPYPRLQLDEFYRGRKSDIEHLSSYVKPNEVILIQQLIPSSIIQL